MALKRTAVQYSDVLGGLALLAVIGICARMVAVLVPGANYLIVAIALGALLTNLYGVPDWARAGVNSHKLLLETGIVLMGIRLTLDSILDAGPTLIGLVIAVIVFTCLLIEFVSRNVFGMADKTGSLLAAGASICGVSAIVAVSGSIHADEDQIAYAVATILLFDALTLAAYPLVGHLLGLTDTVFGVWAGLSMFSTGPVAAAGFAYSETAGQWATVTKLTRNLFIGLAVVAYSVYYARRRATSTRSIDSLSLLWTKFPKFVLGFVAVMVVANLGVLTPTQVASARHAYQWLFLLAFAGLGMHIRVADVRDTGIRPVIVVFVSLLVVSSVTLFVVSALFGL